MFGCSLFAPYILVHRYGGIEPTFSANILLGVTFVLLNLPVLFFDDSVSSKSLVYFPDYSLLKYPIMFICLLLFLALIFNLVAIEPFITAIIHSMEEGETFNKNLLRENNDIIRGSGINLTVWLATPGKLALFLGVYGALSKKIPRIVVYSLLLCSTASILANLKDGGRTGIVQYFLFLFVSIILFIGFCNHREYRRLLIILGGGAVFCLFALTFISFLRFPQEAFYQMYHYIAAGPYFFSTDYAVINSGLARPHYLEYGSDMFPLLEYLISFLRGTNFMNPAVLVKQDASLMAVYSQVAESFHVEFKTIVGYLFVDFAWNMIWILLFLLIVVFLFYRRYWRLRFFMIVAYYCYMILFAPIGFAFAGPPGNIEICWFVLFYFYLSIVEKRGRKVIQDVKTENTTA